MERWGIGGFSAVSTASAVRDDAVAQNKLGLDTYRHQCPCPFDAGRNCSETKTNTFGDPANGHSKILFEYPAKT